MVAGERNQRHQQGFCQEARTGLDQSASKDKPLGISHPAALGPSCLAPARRSQLPLGATHHSAVDTIRPDNSGVVDHCCNAGPGPYLSVPVDASWTAGAASMTDTPIPARFGLHHAPVPRRRVERLAGDAEELVQLRLLDGERRGEDHRLAAGAHHRAEPHAVVATGQPDLAGRGEALPAASRSSPAEWSTAITS